MGLRVTLGHVFSTGCYNKTHRLDGLNHKHLSQSGGWKSEIRVPTWPGSSRRPSSWIADVCLLLVSSHDRERERERREGERDLMCLLVRALISSQWLHLHFTIPSQRPHLQNPSHWT